jgi:hypothetical protein
MQERIKFPLGVKLEGERLELYNLLRKKYPKDKKEKQMELCLQLNDNRIEVYKELFSSN